MSTITISKLDEVHLLVRSDDSTEMDLRMFFKYEFPGAKFTPKYKARLWDGFVYLYCNLRKRLYVGLLDYVHKFAEQHNHDIVYEGEVITRNDISLEEVKQYIKDLNLYGRGSPIEIRDYQEEAVHISLRDNRKVILAPTGSGKSLILYSLIRWYVERNKKVLILVPTVSLVEQLYGDFVDYSTGNKWPVENNCQKLYSGFTKVFGSNVLISTWQSVYTQPKSWFNQFDVLLGDEAHLFKATSLTSIMEKLDECEIKIGATGSIDNSKLNQLVLEGIFGPIHRVTSTKKLMEDNKLSQLKIQAIILKYSDEDRLNNKKADYQAELDFIVTHKKRNAFLSKLAVSTKGNTLLLFQFVAKHGKVLYDDIKALAGDRSVYYIHGGVSAEDREKIRKNLSNETGAIVVASFQTTSTGINIPSIENIIFASPSKSKIRNLQSIGRGLRLNEGKSHCVLYDVADDISFKKKSNHTLRHAAERYKLYTSEGFPFKLIEIKL